MIKIETTPISNLAVIGMCNPRYVFNEMDITCLTEFKIDGKLYSYNIRS